MANINGVHLETHIFFLFYIILTVLFLSFCDHKMETCIDLVDQKGFDTIIGGKQANIFTLHNSNGCVAQFTNYGGRWVSMWIPDKKGRMTDVVLGFNNLSSYMTAGEPYHGAIVGRVCGRINNAKFQIDGKLYNLVSNDGFGKPEKNHLHGGIEGFHKKVWNSTLFHSENDEQGISFKYLSKNGEEGFPGELDVEVTYLLTNNNEIKIEYRAFTNSPTVVNLTNHTFFNLNGEGKGNISNHLMRINAEKYIECDRQLIPTGRLVPVNDSPLDYREYASMGKGIDQNHDQIFKGLGYAAALVIKEKNNSEQQLVAEAIGDISGIKMEVRSNQPSLQIYNAWLFNGADTGKSGDSYEFSGGFVMETQGYPDAPNHPEFPSIILCPGDEYHHLTTYKFSNDILTINEPIAP